MTALPAAVRLRGWEALNNAVAGKHATIDREVSAHHEGPHGRVFLSQEVRLVGEIRLVFTAVDENKASEATVITVTLVHGVRPSSTPTETLKILHVKAAHSDGCGGDVRPKDGESSDR